MDNSTSTISKLKLKDRTLYVKINWVDCSKDLFHIKIYDGDICWSGSFSNESAKENSERVQETSEEYHKNVRISLAGDDEKFTYDLCMVQDKNNSAVFRWKKRFDDAILVHGTVSVDREDTPEGKDKLLDCLLVENKDLKTTVDDYCKQINELNCDLQKYKNELENAVTLKTTVERSLLGKFVQILNAKKLRIQVLEESLVKLNRTS